MGWFRRGSVGSALILFAVATASAQPQPVSDPIRIEAAKCVGETCEPGWLPIRVRISNASDHEVKGRVTVGYLSNGNERISEAFSDETFPKSSRRDLYYYLFVPPVKAQDALVEARLDLGGKAAPRTAELSFKVRLARRYLSISRTPSLMSDLPGKSPEEPQEFNNQRRVEYEAQDGRKDALPESWLGYDRMHLVLLDDYNVQELSEGQRTALVEWVRAGGTLLVSPGPDPLWLDNDIVTRLVKSAPAVVETRRQLEEFEKRFGALHSREDFPFYVFEGGRSILGEGKDRIVTGYDAGLGSVYFLAFDLGRAPFTGWPGRRDLWAVLIQAAPTPPMRETWEQSSPNVYAARTAREALDDRVEPLSRGMSGLPSTLLLLFLILLYLVVIGPVNYFVLRKLNLQMYTVVTVPLIAFVFVIVIIGLGYLTRGVTTRVQRGSVTVVLPGDGGALETAYACVFAASPHGYAFDFGDGMAPFPLYVNRETASAMVLRYNEAGSPHIEDYPLKLWETGVFVARGTRDLGGPLRASFADGKVTVANGGKKGVVHGILLSRSGAARSEPVAVAAGANAEIPVVPAIAHPGRLTGLELADLLGVEHGEFPTSFLELVSLQIPTLTRPGRAGELVFLGLLDEDPAPLRVDGSAPSLLHDIPLVLVEVESPGK